MGDEWELKRCAWTHEKLLPSLQGAVAWRVGLFGPSMGLTPTRCALRGQPAAVQQVPDKFVEAVGSSTTSLRQIRKELCLRCRARLRGGWDCSAHPWASPLRAARYGASLRLSNKFQANLSNPGGFVHNSLSGRYAESLCLR